MRLAVLSDIHSNLPALEAVLADAADSIARIWLRVWHRYREWRKKQDG